MNYSWKYRAIEEHQHHPDLGEYLTFGIEAWEETRYGWLNVNLIHDVTPEFEFAQTMTKKFNCFQLSPIHLKDVVEDMIF